MGRAQKFSILWIELYIFILESDTSFIPTTASKIDKMSANKELEALIQRLESVATRLEKTQGGGAAVEDDGEVAPFVGAFDDILTGPFKTFCDLSQKIGGDVTTHGAMVEAAFKAQREFLVIASKSKKPADKDLQSLLLPLSNKISEIQDFREKNRRSIYFNHLSAISESIPALGWVAVSPAPGPYVKEMNDAGQFYTNRVLKDSKDSRASKDWNAPPNSHVDWTKSWVSTLVNLQALVKQFHTTGLVWNPKGGDAKAQTVSTTNGGPAAPPPPPPPPPPEADDIPSGGGADSGRNALLASPNQGENVTKGLKKVTSDMQTHKNPGLRGSAPIPAKEKKSVSPPKYGASTAPQKPPKFGLEGKKWVVEFQRNNSGLVIEECEVNQSVYVYKCDGSTIQVKGKVNNIILDSCKKTAVVFKSVVSSCEFINCQSVQMQVMESCPTISVEKTDGCQMYLSKGLTPEIITAKSSEMNVIIPTDDDDYVEQPIPEQFKTIIKGTKLDTKASESV